MISFFSFLKEEMVLLYEVEITLDKHLSIPA